MKETAEPAVTAPQRSTQQELENRIRWVENKLRTAPILKHQLFKEIKDRYGCSRTQCEVYARSARERILLSLQQTKAEFRAASLCTYESILASSDASAADKCRAQSCIDELLGLKAPIQSQVLLDASLHAVPSEAPCTEEELSKYLPLEVRVAMLKGMRAIAAARENAKPMEPGARPTIREQARLTDALPAHPHPIDV